MSKVMSDRLKALRKEKGKTQQDAAEEMFMSRTTLAKYESPGTDFNSMRAKELLRLAEYYNCDPRYISGDISCKDKEVSDIHDATGLDEDAIISLMQRRVDAYKYGFSFDTYDHLLFADLISYVITHFDDSLLKQYVEYSAFLEIGKELIETKREHGDLTDADNYATSETIRDTVVHDYFAQKAKDDLKDNFRTSLEEWMKGIVGEYSAMLLEKIDQYRK